MNKKTIQKFIDEVNKEPFRKDYVLGMLETLMENLPEDKTCIPVHINPITTTTASHSSPTITDESEQLDLMAKAKLETVKMMST